MAMWSEESVGINQDTYAVHSLPCMRRDILYPCGFQRWESKPRMTSLLTLAAQKVAADSKCTLAATQCCPAELCANVLRQALFKGNDRSVDALVSKWPGKSLVLRLVLPKLMDYTKAVYDEYYCVNVSCRQTQAIMHVVTSFVKNLKEGNLKQLRFLDISGFCSAKVVQEFILKQTKLINRSDQLKVQLKRQQTVSQEYVIRTSLMVDSDNFSTCLTALRNHKSDSVVLGIQTEILNLNHGLSPNNIRKLLSYIAVEKIEGLVLAYSLPWTEDDYKSVVESLKTMTSLRALSLFVNNEVYKDFLEKETACLQKLQHLHLDLTMRGNLKKVLDPHPLLNTLEIENIRTTEEFRYLSECDHLNTLQELRITGNFPSGHFLLQLLQKTTNLKGLYLSISQRYASTTDDMQIDRSSFIKVLSRLEQLRYLNMNGSFLNLDKDNSSDCLTSHELDPVTCLPQLEYFTVEMIDWTGWSGTGLIDDCIDHLIQKAGDHVTEMRMQRSLPKCLLILSFHIGYGSNPILD